MLPSGLVLPEALEVTLRHRFLLSPVLARSRLAARSASAGVFSCHREQIEFWFARYGEDANWLLETGEESGVVSLQIDLRLARQSLAYLAGDDPAWQHSLRFTTGSRWHVLFECRLASQGWQDMSRDDIRAEQGNGGAVLGK